MPLGPPLLRVTWRRSYEERWSIEFGPDDVVRSVSQVDEAEEGRDAAR